jgi:hypothetical protein
LLGVCIAAVPKLTELWLTKTNVLGDLAFAQKCPNLVLLDVYGTQVARRYFFAL